VAIVRGGATLRAGAAVVPGPPYRALMVDPPWSYRNAWRTRRGNRGHYASGDPRVLRGPGAAANYKTLSVADLEVLPVDRWAEVDAHLYLWAPNAHIESAHQLARAWGFEPVTLITWCKTQIGMGVYFRATTEQIVFCVRGRLATLRRDLPTHFVARRTRHSEKPDAAYELVEAASPGPYLDVFARRQRPGWAVYGDEVAGSLPLVDLAAVAAGGAT
jgi:N6-adenosine-specific RNA methylase IME4